MVKHSKITLDLSEVLKWEWSLHSCQDYLYPMSLIWSIVTGKKKDALNWKIRIEGWGMLEQFISNLNGLGTRPPDKPQGLTLLFAPFEMYFHFEKGIRPKRSCCSISPRKESGKGYWINAKKPLSRFNGKSCLPFPWDPKRGVDNLNSYRNVNGIDKDEDVQRGRKHFKSFEWS